ncbi:MAG: DUF502 domain-containing protein [Candidatus Omnitrophota bacterium]
MKKRKNGFLKRILNLLWKRVVAGILVVVPFYITYHVIRIIFFYLDGLSQPIAQQLIGTRVEGVGFVLTFLLLYFLGLIVANVFGRSLVRWFERLLLRAPIIKNVYFSVKQTVEALSVPRKDKFKRVVLVEYPRKGIYAIGFVTNSTLSPDGEKLLTVLISAPPNPATGNIILLPESDAIGTDLTIEDAMKFVVSGGLLTPKEINKE